MSLRFSFSPEMTKKVDFPLVMSANGSTIPRVPEEKGENHE
jgi:hypothetical protein